MAHTLHIAFYYFFNGSHTLMCNLMDQGSLTDDLGYIDYYHKEVSTSFEDFLKEKGVNQIKLALNVPKLPNDGQKGNLNGFPIRMKCELKACKSGVIESRRDREIVQSSLPYRNPSSPSSPKPSYRVSVLRHHFCKRRMAQDSPPPWRSPHTGRRTSTYQSAPGMEPPFPASQAPFPAEHPNILDPEEERRTAEGSDDDDIPSAFRMEGSRTALRQADLPSRERESQLAARC